MNEIVNKVKAPATALIIVGVMNFGLGLAAILSGLLRLTGIMGMNELPSDEAERIGYLIGTFGGYGAGFIGLIASPFIIYGAVQMLNCRKYGFAKLAAILAIVPITSCCFVVGIPVGIWAFICLRDPEVKDYFESSARFARA